MNAGYAPIQFLGRIGRFAIFLVSILTACPAAMSRPRTIIKQIATEGALSLILIVPTAMLTGMVLVLQSYRVLSVFGAGGEIGSFIAFGVLRDLGPVLAAILFAGRSGTAIASEIGLMNATSQLSALEMMSVDPMTSVVAPRFIAGVISLALLSSIFSLMAIGFAGGYFMAVIVLHMDGGTYWESIHNSVGKLDIFKSLIKSVVFGIAISWISVYEGYYARPNAAGVARAVTNTAVMSALAVIGLNFILSAFMF